MATAKKMEKRNAAGIELRAADDFSLVGIAAPYGVLSHDLGGYRETIAPGCFTRSLKEGGDVRCLFNHSANHILGRLKNKTLTLTDTPAGLAFRCQLNQRDSGHQSVYAQVKRGDLDECSFAFTVRPNGEQWNADRSRRTLTD